MRLQSYKINLTSLLGDKSGGRLGGRLSQGDVLFDFPESEASIK